MRTQLPGDEASSFALWRAIADRWLDRIRDRAAMVTMTEREMRDAGLNAYDVARECRKPI